MVNIFIEKKIKLSESTGLEKLFIVMSKCCLLVQVYFFNITYKFDGYSGTITLPFLK